MGVAEGTAATVSSCASGRSIGAAAVAVRACPSTCGVACAMRAMGVVFGTSLFGAPLNTGGCVTTATPPGRYGSGFPGSS